MGQLLDEPRPYVPRYGMFSIAPNSKLQYLRMRGLDASLSLMFLSVECMKFSEIVNFILLLVYKKPYF